MFDGDERPDGPATPRGQRSTASLLSRSPIFYRDDIGLHRAVTVSGSKLTSWLIFSFVLDIVTFVAAMLALIWGLGRV